MTQATWREITDNPVADCDVILMMDDGTQVKGEFYAPSRERTANNVLTGFGFNTDNRDDPPLPIKWRIR